MMPRRKDWRRVIECLALFERFPST